MSRVYNFSAGPSVLPELVLKRVQRELLNYDGTGISVLEMSHRSKEFMKIFETARQLLRKLLQLPHTHEILFLQGGATLQFSMIPMNLMKQHKRSVYINTGVWSKKAIKEAQKYGEVLVLGDSSDQHYSSIPDVDWSRCPKDVDYIHITSNNTIYGTTYHRWPQIEDIPLVVDMSSNILSDDIDVSQASLVYAGAQKNIGPSGLTVVIISKNFAQKISDARNPLLLDYQNHIVSHSMINTPPCFSIYVAGLVFQWLEEQGGVVAIQERNHQKAKLLYDAIDNLKLFSSMVSKKDRSLMNIPFQSDSKKKDNLFIEEARKCGLINLNGHRVVGGMRASLYNAMEVKGVEKLVDFMEKFSLRYA